MKSKNLLVNKEKTEYTTMKRGSKEEEKGMERCDKTGIKTWWSARHPERKRIGNNCPCKEWHNLEKELENKSDNQNPAVRDASEKCTVVQLQNLGCVKEWPEKTKQFL